MWIIGGEATAIVSMALYIAKQWKERRDEYVAELRALRKLIGEGGD